MSNYHHLGTTRMHGDPRRGVVDADGRVHSMTNVYVAGSSVFPTGGYLNPTLTILALAIRLAETICRRWAPSRVPIGGLRLRLTGCYREPPGRLEQHVRDVPRSPTA